MKKLNTMGTYRNKLICISLIILLILVMSAPSIVYGNAGDEFGGRYSNNRDIYNGLLANFRYEKTIDMANAPDRSKIPNVDFNFTLSVISEDEEEANGIGTVYGNETDAKCRIVEGSLGDAVTNMPFSKVSFRETDTYDAELTRLIDARDSGDSVINRILKYDWGEMRSSDHLQTAIARKPTDEENRYRNDPASSSWPDDTIVWRCFHEYPYDYENPGSYEDGCQQLWDYDFATFDYVKQFNLAMNPSVTYYAYTYKRPLLTHEKKDSSGNYLSVSKGLLSAVEYETWIDALRGINPTEMDESEDIVFLSYRFLLNEDPVDGEDFVTNTETKIVDFIPHYGGIQSVLLVFNDLNEADNFYKNLFKTSESFYSWSGRVDSYNYQTPRSSFTNAYVEPEQELGNLKVYNEVTGSGADQEKAFNFIVKLSDNTVNGTYGEMEFKNGVAEFTLKHGHSKVAENLPAGIKYTVEEKDYEPYTVTKSGSEGVTISDETVSVNFVNHKADCTGKDDETNTPGGSDNSTGKDDGTKAPGGSDNSTNQTGGTKTPGRPDNSTNQTGGTKTPGGSANSVNQNSGTKTPVLSAHSNNSGTPKTGDDSNLWSFVVIMFIASAGLACTAVYRHKRNR